MGAAEGVFKVCLQNGNLHLSSEMSDCLASWLFHGSLRRMVKRPSSVLPPGLSVDENDSPEDLLENVGSWE